METITSLDGTTIAVESVGAGPPLVLVVGAFCDRTSTRTLAGLLAAQFTVHAYDRRGRGDSSDTAPYTVERELEDLAAVVEHAAAGTPALYGHSGGAIVALRAVAQGLPVSRVAAYEPPWEVTEDRAEHNAALAEQVGALVKEGRRDEALAAFIAGAWGLPPSAIDQMKGGLQWKAMDAFVPTLPYECAVTGDQRIPTARLAAITVPTLLLAGGESDAWARDAVTAAAAAVPGAQHQLIPGQGHGVDQTALAPVLAKFLSASTEDL